MTAGSCGHNGPLGHIQVCELCLDKPQIFAFLNGGSPGWFQCLAMAEDGEVLSGHVCSNELFVPHDLGVTSDWKHDKYRQKYPDGFRVVYVPNAEVEAHVGLQAAFAKNAAAGEEKRQQENAQAETAY